MKSGAREPQTTNLTTATGERLQLLRPEEIGFDQLIVLISVVGGALMCIVYSVDIQC